MNKGATTHERIVSILHTYTGSNAIFMLLSIFLVLLLFSLQQGFLS